MRANTKSVKHAHIGADFISATVDPVSFALTLSDSSGVFQVQRCPGSMADWIYTPYGYSAQSACVVQPIVAEYVAEGN